MAILASAILGAVILALNPGAFIGYVMGILMGLSLVGLSSRGE